MNAMTKNSLGREELTSRALQHQSPSSKEVRVGTQGRDLEAGTDVEAMEECCLLVWPSWLSSYILISPKTTRPGVALPPLRWTQGHELLNKKMHCKHAYGQSNRGIFSIKIPLFPGKPRFV